ncbi:MAG: YihY family inner membrane protein [Burkholderiales bacterium]
MKRFYRFLLYVIRRFSADNSSQTAASLTYTSLLAIVPLITIGLTVISAFPAFKSISETLNTFLLQNMVPETASKVISVYMIQFSQNAGKLTAIGIGALAITALLLMQTIEQALNSIWHVRYKRGLMQRFLIYWVLLTLGPLLIGIGLYATTYLAGLAFGSGEEIHGLKLLLLNVGPIILTVTALALLYYMVPNRYVPVSHAWTGGLVAGCLFEAMKLLFSHYISHFPTYTMIYGAFAILPLFLLWIYLSWLTVLFGATVTAALPFYQNTHNADTPAPGNIFYVALLILKHLALAQRQGKTVSIKELIGLMPENWAYLEFVLLRLAELHWALRSAKGWTLALPPDRIVLRDIFEQLVFQPDNHIFPLETFIGQPEINLSGWMNSGHPARTSFQVKN